ncbi:bifunctional GNAT family N-acetyltransferase/hotdog fold thioesterase [Thalassotalea ponticola]|uniref:bifunctional GNAT family N-acetyltransferase/hotdog fold thioesterase n=1 Tax=Thalassotalea ponticola TaxID=1523392 RepID=UPI0025B5B58C|nr:bifunctional GNAT family N-acetyltransferase/hotdog fold thioesterase [Thalassotalea ponticola]MDN3653725.1 bifunctional GNAT family N-acetyltransferase/hotdog fold thioesterase [Thalassotalea ponticola]
MSYRITSPQSDAQFEAYYQLRYCQLRQAWQQPVGSELDDLEQQAVHRMVVDQCDRVVGVGRVHKVGVDKANIRFMAVDDAHQGKGLGAKLLTALEQAAAERGVSTIELQARENALDFYRNCGYQILAKSHLLYGQIQHYKMQKTIALADSGYERVLQRLERVWHKTIPLSKFMQIKPCSVIDGALTTCADRQANLNLHNTMFAGSVYTLATLTGWGQVYLLLADAMLDGDIVLADASIEYRKPLHGFPTARTLEQDGNIGLLESKNKARIHVQVGVFDGDNQVATFRGKYVILAR